MSLHRRWNAVIALLLILGFAPMKAQAYSGGTTLDYTEGSIDLYGYSETWRDYWNPYSSLTCTNYGWDEYYQSYLCMNYILRAYYPSVTAELWNPNFALDDSQYEWNYTNAHVNLVASQPLMDGRWYANGVHMVEEDVYWGYIWWGGEYYWEYLGTNVDTFDYSSAEADVGACSSATVATMIAEYPQYGVNYYPLCSAFSRTGGSAHFSWSELNGGFTNGNPHSPWGIVTAALTTGLEATRTNYNRGGLNLTSGYRCPHGNAGLPDAVPQSDHMEGGAADMFSAIHSWDQTEHNLVRDAAITAFAGYWTEWNTYPSNQHFHARW
jgi:hypothetical protein